MRVCHVITKPELGGAQLSTLNILAGLPRDIYDISIITSPNGILSSDFKNLRDIKVHFSPFLIRQINPIYDIFAFIHIYLIYRSNRYNFVHTHSSKAGIIGRLAAWLAGVPVIVHTVHGWPFNNYQPVMVRRCFLLLEKFVSRITTRIICVSRRDIETGVTHRIAAPEKFSLVKYGISLNNFRRSSSDILQKRKRLGINNNDPVIGMIACLKPQKSPLDYIKACEKVYRKLPNVNFLLIGDGALRSGCKRLLSSTSLNGRFVFSGWRRDVPDILDILDIMVLTSKWEGMPIVVIEALSKGCLVIATNVGGTPELIKDGVTGYLVRPGGHQEIADKILMSIKDTEVSDKIRTRASESIDESFDIRRMLKEIDNLYRNLSQMVR